jgi:ribosomal protein S17E
MPTKSQPYKSISVSTEIYERYRKTFEEKKNDLAKKGITSFAGYITSMLERLMEENEIFARQAPLMEELAVDETGNIVYIKDNKTGRIAGVRIKADGFHCDIDDRNDCIHVGFALALPSVYKALDRAGIKLPKLA